MMNVVVPIFATVPWALLRMCFGVVFRFESSTSGYRSPNKEKGRRLAAPAFPETACCEEQPCPASYAWVGDGMPGTG
ncbi:hypothetical protein JJL56_03110 [Azospirillum sp. YIM DDC1]|uniref:Secreted protein n=1 Tax=Azospirillum aestuarii TaxID=2802052 RepID=A0ABS1HU70_9PROT|nr:hypothetical protein [Azospirillum aestuarii]MBK4717848.1 hypothetical protein [Azospirillum aestuarii]